MSFLTVDLWVRLFVWLTLLGQVGLVVLVGGLFLPRLRKRLLSLIQRNHRWLKISFGVALGATLGSLFLSEVAGWEPCKLCWYQRVLMYPQVLLLGVAWVCQTTDVRKYVLALSSLGILISLYHYFVQRFALSGCSLNGVDCRVRYIFAYGYLTVPVMALTVFLWLLVLSLLAGRENFAKRKEGK